MNRQTLLAVAAAWLVRGYSRLLRIRVRDSAGLGERPADDPVIWVFWHSRIMVMPVVYRRWFPQREGSVLTSASRDGEILARFMKSFGCGAIRGSSSRRGGQAMLELRREIARGRDVVITPDGPRGPREVMGPGAVRLALLTGAPIMPISVEAERYWQAPSWDRFRIPKPFSRVEVVFHPPEWVKAEAEMEPAAHRIVRQLSGLPQDEV